MLDQRVIPLLLSFKRQVRLENVSLFDIVLLIFLLIPKVRFEKFLEVRSENVCLTLIFKDIWSFRSLLRFERECLGLNMLA
jgi:hypothetical protein